jgi:hypothetical protein
MSNNTEAGTCRRVRRTGIVLAALALVVVILLLVTLRDDPPQGAPVVISLLGFTNGIGSDRPFALFMISNQWSRPIRWSGDWAEVEGMADFRARTTNPSLPANYPSLALKGGDSFVWAVGQPNLEPHNRWRLTLQYRKHTLKSRWFDWSMRNPRVPMKVGPLVLVDPQKVLGATNQQRSSSEWVAWRIGTQSNVEPAAVD